MKKLISIALTTALLASCSQESIFESADLVKNESLSNFRTTTEAIDIANSILNTVSGNSRNSLKINTSDIHIVTSRNARSTTDTLLYALDIEDDNGFIIIAGPKNISPIIAITESGSFSSEETMANEGFQYALAAAKDYAKEAAERVIIKPVDPKPFSYYDTISADCRQTPRVTVKWGQAWPENIYAPNKCAGCEPVAMAQVLSYFKAPSSMTYTFSGHDVASNSLNWDNLTKHIKSLSYYKAGNYETSAHLAGCSSSQSDHYVLGRLVRQLGQLIGSRYGYLDEAGNFTTIDNGNPATSGNFTNMCNVMKNLLPNKTMKTGTDIWSVYNYLKDGGVALVRGAVVENGDGHCWVADAIWEYGTIINFYSMSYVQGDNEYHLVSSEGKIDYLIHYNWGWCGNSNGFFSRNILNPTKAERYDSENSSNNYDLKYDIRFLYIK